MRKCLLLMFGASLSSAACVYAGPAIDGTGDTAVGDKDAGASADGAVADAGAVGDAGTSDGGASDAGTKDSGPPPEPWVNVTNNLLSLAAGGGDVMVIAHSGADTVYVGSSGKGLFATDDGGDTWYALGTGPGSDKIGNGPTRLIFDPANSAQWWEVGIYGDGPYVTSDGGKTFRRLGNIAHNDLLSIDFTDPKRLTMLAGGHETNKRLHLSRDGGQTWTDIGPGLPTTSGFATLPLVLDAQTFLLGACTAGGCGVIRTEDGGQSWSLVTDLGTVNAAPLVASDGTIYWTLVGGAGMIVSEDGGKTWRMTAPGPLEMSSISSPIELEDGRVVSLGSTTLLATTDEGVTWTPLGAPLPFQTANCAIYGFAYSHMRKEFFVNHNDCTGKIVANSVFRSPLP